MAPRASWKGYLTSLASCPVRLYTATSTSDRIAFNLLHKDTHNRVAMKPVDPELGQVERSDLVKGYQDQKNQYVILAFRLREGQDRVDRHDRHRGVRGPGRDRRLYDDTPYFLAPDGKIAEETFVVLREAMKKTGKTAVARVVMSNRERVVSIDVRDKGMLMQTLRRPNEVRKSSEYFDEIPEKNGVDKEMLQLAEKLIEQKTNPFDPGAFTDRYEEGLMEIIRAKVAGETPVMAAAPERGKVINLMDALKKSLSDEKPPAASKGRKGSAQKTTAAKSQKSAPRRKSA